MALEYPFTVFFFALALYFVPFSAWVNEVELMRVFTTIQSQQIYGFLLISIVSWFFLITINTKRLHDFGRSGWWQLTYFIPLVGMLAFFVIGLYPPSSGANSYGTR